MLIELANSSYSNLPIRTLCKPPWCWISCHQTGPGSSRRLCTVSDGPCSPAPEPRIVQLTVTSAKFINKVVFLSEIINVIVSTQS